jgi:hypothetical protein
MACENEKRAWDDAKADVQRLIDTGAPQNDIKAARTRASNLEAAYNLCLRNPPLPTPTHIKGQCQASAGDWTYWFVVDSEGRVVYTKWTFGGGNLGWHEIPGGARSDIAPAAALIKHNNDYFITLTIMDRDGNLLFNQADLGQNPENAESWVGWK